MLLCGTGQPGVDVPFCGTDEKYKEYWLDQVREAGARVSLVKLEHGPHYSICNNNCFAIFYVAYHVYGANKGNEPVNTNEVDKKNIFDVRSMLQKRRMAELLGGSSYNLIADLNGTCRLSNIGCLNLIDPANFVVSQKQLLVSFGFTLTIFEILNLQDGKVFTIINNAKLNLSICSINGLWVLTLIDKKNLKEDNDPVKAIIINKVLIPYQLEFPFHGDKVYSQVCSFTKKHGKIYRRAFYTVCPTFSDLQRKLQNVFKFNQNLNTLLANMVFTAYMCYQKPNI